MVFIGESNSLQILNVYFIALRKASYFHTSDSFRLHTLRETFSQNILGA